MDSLKNSARGFEPENGLKPKKTAMDANSSGHLWTLPAELLDSRLHCHACPQLADTEGQGQGRLLSGVHDSLCPSSGL